MKAKSLFILSVLALVMVNLACQFTSPLTNLFATPTSTATATVTPSPTPSPTPTATVTPTPLPSGRIKEDQPDGSILFTDYDGKYKIALPVGWTVIITQKDDIEAMLESFPADSNLKTLLESLENSPNNTLRAFCFNFKNTSGGYTPNINIGYDTNPFLSDMSVGDLVNVYQDVLPTMFKDLKIIDAGTRKTSSEIDIGFLKVAWGTDLANGQRLDVRQKQVYIKSGNGVVILTLSENKNSSADLEPEFDKISDGIQLLGK